MDFSNSQLTKFKKAPYVSIIVYVCTWIGMYLSISSMYGGQGLMSECLPQSYHYLTFWYKISHRTLDLFLFLPLSLSLSLSFLIKSLGSSCSQAPVLGLQTNAATSSFSHGCWGCELESSYMYSRYFIHWAISPTTLFMSSEKYGWRIDIQNRVLKGF